MKLSNKLIMLFCFGAITNNGIFAKSAYEVTRSAIRKNSSSEKVKQWAEQLGKQLNERLDAEQKEALSDFLETVKDSFLRMAKIARNAKYSDNPMILDECKMKFQIEGTKILMAYKKFSDSVIDEKSLDAEDRDELVKDFNLFLGEIAELWKIVVANIV